MAVREVPAQGTIMGPIHAHSTVEFAVAVALSAVMATGCTPSAAECQSDGDCAPEEQCISGGGVLMTGGRCVSFSPSPVDADARGPEDGGDTVPPSTDGEPFEEPDGGDTSVASDTDDAGEASDGGETTMGPPDGRAMDGQSADTGRCNEEADCPGCASCQHGECVDDDANCHASSCEVCRDGVCKNTCDGCLSCNGRGSCEPDGSKCGSDEACCPGGGCTAERNAGRGCER